MILYLHFSVYFICFLLYCVFFVFR